MILKLHEYISENEDSIDMELMNKTILFTDIKGSSELWKSNEKTMFKNLNKLETLITKIVDKYNGLILKSIGDAFMISFDKLIDAVSFTIELQKEEPIKVNKKEILLRIGISSGKVYLETKRQGKSLLDYFGNVVNTASRMESKVSEVGGFAFSFFGKIEDKKKLDDLLEKECKIEIIDFKEKCSKDKRIRSERLLTDSHKFLCESLNELKGVDEVTAYKCKIK
jgi:hypothetical protein